MPKRGPHKSKAKVAPLAHRRTFIKDWRIFLGMTVAELADKAGMSTGNLSAIENQKQGYSTKSLAAIADALGVDTGTLLRVNPTEGAPMWAIWVAATEAQREHIADLARTVVKPKR